MSSDTNKAIVRRAIEDPWSGKLDSLDDLIASDYVGYDPASAGVLRGPEGLKEFIAAYRDAFPDARITVEAQMSHGDLVATRWSGTGTHEGALLGVQPTGQTVTFSGITVSRVEAGKIVQEFQSWDTFGLIEQLGGVHAAALVAEPRADG